MNRAARHGAAIVYGVALLVWLLDRGTKIWAEHRLPGRPIELIPGALTLRFVTNPGGAFSLGGSEMTWVFSLATLAIVTVIAVTAFRARSTWTGVGLGLVLGGGLGNLTDRLLRGPRLSGEVVDFVDPHIWPVFNIADASIVVGAVIIVIASLRAPGDPEPDPAAAGASSVEAPDGG